MNWFSDRIDIHYKMYCLNCRYSFYPYSEKWAFGKSPEQVFNQLSIRHCPECNCQK